ncbi:hypothetical protein DNTS_031711 [Danionella cerebrum]|uniref:Alpha-galactosidase n=1 Tax=Danionella cerebrum TaxID=2873325 RepID=A0A553QB60_9TELE|nr:hypothetical protein DNTS_031711 [Danionella translucida]
MKGTVYAILMAISSASFALDNGLMQTPPMGWLAWERFRCDIDCQNDPDNCISERLFMDMADRLSEDGWRELGYIYINIDDCWSSMERDAAGRLQADPKRFPRGIDYLAKYVHSRGLKLGIYGDLGTHTCGGYPGTTLDKIQMDAETFASWGVDMLKLDGIPDDVSGSECYRPSYWLLLQLAGISRWTPAQTPRGLCVHQVNYTLLGQICNLWRNYDDIQDSWDSVLGIVDWFFDNQDVLQPAAAPGQWNDPDMLIVGDFGLSLDQSRAQMALWCIMAAPLFMSNDLRSISSGARAILQNPAAITINQDPLGIQGKRLIKEKSRIEVFWRPLSKGASALVYDVFLGRRLPELKDSQQFVVSINPSGVVMWYIWPTGQWSKEAGLDYFSEKLIGPKRHQYANEVNSPQGL